MDYCIGEYGVCIDDGGGKSRYLVAGKYTGGDVPESMVVYKFSGSDWAVFNCIGPIPETIQSVNTQIFRKWLPGNPEVEPCGIACVDRCSATERFSTEKSSDTFWGAEYREGKSLHYKKKSH